ncbi:MAG: hypothetical protein ABGX47_00890 [Martelella sp.]|uniref:hypothetical protein n=1 Tax=Martelella sp. TaxID=1969699 RepID=UPI0032426011
MALIVGYLKKDKNSDALTAMKPHVVRRSIDSVVACLSKNEKRQIIVSDQELNSAELAALDGFPVEQIKVVKNVDEAKAHWRSLVAEWQKLKYRPGSYVEKAENLSWPIGADEMLWLEREILYGEKKPQPRSRVVRDFGSATIWR